MSKAEMSQRRSRWPILRIGLLFTLALGVPPWQAGAQAPPSGNGYATASWDVLDAVTTVDLDTTTLRRLGLTTFVEGLVTGHTAQPLSVVSPEAPSFQAAGTTGLRAAIGADGFHGFEGGPIRHRGGLALRGAPGDFDLSHLELRVGRPSSTLELVDAAGVALLTTADAQWIFEAGRGQLHYLNADVRVLPALAQRLGDERYTGMTVGILDLDATLRVGPVPDGPLPPVGAVPPPCGDWSGTVDVSLTNMSSIGQAGIATVNGRSVVVVLPSADLKNVGTANVPWYSKFTNLGVPPWNDQHPFLVWQMVRSSNGGSILEPLGRSDLKHAFLTLNNGCDAGACTDSHVLGLGCTDVYSTGTNNSVGSLAPRAEVTASTGIWAHCGGIVSHFDQNGDCVQDFSGSGENAFTHGLKAAESDLMVAGSSYYVEAFYIIRNDVNIFNSMGYRQVAPAKPGSVWTFPTVGAYTQGPAINAWVNPTTPGPGADNRTLDTGEGHVQLAVKVTQLSATRWRYAYALQNHDFDRRIKSIHVPFNTIGHVIENATYADGDGFAANDWTPTVDVTGITFAVPDTAVTPPAELDYASLVSFRFDSDVSSGPAQASLGPVEAGSSVSSLLELRMQTLAPAAGAPSGADFYTVSPCRLLDTRPSSAIASGTVRVLDVPAVSACGVPANATAVAINVTAVGAAGVGFLTVFSAEPSTPVSTVNFDLGMARANNTIAMVSLGGKLKIRPFLNAGGSTHVVVDVVGYFVPSP